MVGNAMNTEIAAQIETIENSLVKDSVFGFDPSILLLLDNVEIGQREIENLKSRLGPPIFTYLFSIANSAYHGSLKMGAVQHFYDVVARLGMQYTKVLILQHAIHSLAKGGHEAEIIYAKSFSASIVGRIMARGLGFTDDDARKVELACLLSSLGILMMTVYRNHYHTGDLILSDDFIEENHPYLTERIINRFQLPEYLNEMLLSNYLTLNRMDLALPSVVKFAIATVDWSFRTLGNKLVIRSSYTTLEDRFSPSMAGIIEEKFTAAGLKKYLNIIAAPTHTSQKMH